MRGPRSRKRTCKLAIHRVAETQVSRISLQPTDSPRSIDYDESGASMKNIRLWTVLVLAGLAAGCSREDRRETRDKLHDAGQQVKHDLQDAQRELNKDLKQAEREAKPALEKAGRDASDAMHKVDKSLEDAKQRLKDRDKNRDDR